MKPRLARYGMTRFRPMMLDFICGYKIYAITLIAVLQVCANADARKGSN